VKVDELVIGQPAQLSVAGPCATNDTSIRAPLQYGPG
jgi:hypothetical protein